MLMKLLLQLFPVRSFQGSDAYRQAQEGDQDYVRNTDDLKNAIGIAPKEVSSVIHAHAKDYLAQEDKRTDSIISRGQGLLVAQTFLGGLLAFGGVVAGRTDIFSGVWLWVTTAIFCYIVVQTVLLTWYALICTGGVGYPRIGSSDLIRFASGNERAAVAGLALQSVLNYRKSVIINDWRFQRLTAAQNALRNTSYALGVMVVVVIFLTYIPSTKPSDSAVMSGKIQQSLAEFGTRFDQKLDAATTAVKTELAGINATLVARDTKPELAAIGAALAEMRARPQIQDAPTPPPMKPKDVPVRRPRGSGPTTR